jgi:hypothetical protein
MSFWDAGHSDASAMRFSFQDILEFTQVAVTQSPFIQNVDWEHDQLQRDKEHRTTRAKHLRNTKKPTLFFQHVLSIDQASEREQEELHVAKAELLVELEGMRHLCELL